MKAIPSIDRNTVFVEGGLIALRNEDGSFREPVPFFIAADSADVTSAGILRSEAAVCEDVGKAFAMKYGQYLDGLRDIERHRKRSKSYSKSSGGVR